MTRQFRNLQLYLFLTAFIMLCYSCNRAVFLWWNWKSFQNQEVADLLWAFAVGWRFDLSALCLLSLVFFLLAAVLDFVRLPQRFTKLLEPALALSFVVAQVFFMIVNWGDVEFVNFVGRRFTSDSFFIASELPGKLGSILLTYWPLALGALSFAVGTVVFCFWMYKEFKPWELNGAKKTFFTLLLGVLLILGSRGGLQFKPLSFVQAQVFKVPSLNNLVLNSTFTVLKSVGKAKLSRKRWLPEGLDAKKFLNGSLDSPVVPVDFKPHPNVVLIIIEGMNLEYLGEPYAKVTYAPFLQSLAQKSLSWNHFFANGRRSIEGIASIYAGIPSLMSEPFITSPFQTNTYEGLGTVFSKNAYATSFFHGGANGTMFFDSFMKATGVTQYFGLNEYPERDSYDGTWGIFDEPYLQYMVEQVNKMPQPFFTSVFTLSSHHPFKVPEKYSGVFNKGVAPIHESIGYTDFALKKFFESAQQQPWFQNTLFVITADHTSQSNNAEYDNEVGHYRIPLLMYYPGFTKKDWPAIDTSEVGSQIDILPTLVDILKLQSTYKNYLTQSLFRAGPKGVVHFNDGRYQFIEEDLALQWNSVEGYRLYDWHRDPLAQEPLNTSADLARKEEMILKLQSTLDYFGQGMWDNKLYFPN